MKLEPIQTAVIIAAGLALLLAAKKGGIIGPITGEQQRMAGVDHWYASNAGQTAGVQQAVTANWQQLQGSVFKTQPDFWV